VADDDAALRNLVVELLTSCGYRVMTAEDGRDALEKFRQSREKIDLVILDVVMPKLNGKEAWDAIRSISPGCKALFMTGYADDNIPRKGLDDAGLVYVTKPLRPQTLLRKIRDLLDA